jgi:hypothetical protein
MSMILPLAPLAEGAVSSVSMEITVLEETTSVLARGESQTVLSSLGGAVRRPARSRPLS